MNNTMMLGLFALGGLAYFLIQRGDWRHWGGSLLDSGRPSLPAEALILAPPAAQRRPDNPPMFRGRNRLPEDADLDIGI